MTEAQQIAELQRLLKASSYERDFLQKRLDALRSVKDQLIRLIETPTLQERIEAGVSEFDLLKAIGQE